MAELSGLIAATLTPFVSSVGPVDYEWLPAHLRFLEQGGVEGIAPMGTTGEGPSLGLGERERMLDLIMEHRGGMFVMAGTGCASLADTIALSNYALERGVDALMVLPPFYYKNLSDAGVYDYFRAVCDALPQDAKIVLYHIPKYSGVPISQRVIDDLLETNASQIFGVKDSGGDAAHTAALIARYPSLAIYGGSDGLVARTLQDGGRGVISAIANAFPRLLRAVVDAHASGEDTAAAQERLLKVRELVKNYDAQASLKAVLPWVSELGPSFVRAPLANLGDDALVSLRQGLADLGEIAA
jgi:4-hydroxy-tetrahydrodipicolinate synthase